MLALRWHGRGDVRLDEVAEPAQPRPGFTVISVSLCGICGSDLAEYQDGPRLIRGAAHLLTGQAPPITLGHEFVGRVVTSSCDGIKPGARVTADACWRCGRCDACLRGDYHLCRYGGSIGLHSDGAFAALVSVPDYCLVSVPAAVPDDAAAMTEPLAVALHALDRGALNAGDDVLVLGFGPIGAAGALLARALGARPTVVDLSEERLEVAGRLALPTLPGGADLPRRVRRLLGSGGADVVLDATGSARALPDAIECARRGGRIVVAGLAKEPGPLDPTRLTLFERSLVGSLGYRRDLPRVLRLMESRAFDPTSLVSGIVALADAATVMRDLAESPRDRIKVLVDVQSDAVRTGEPDKEIPDATN